MSSEEPVVVDMEIPDVIERLPKPDKAEHDAKISKLDGAIKKLQARTNVIRTEMDALKTNRGGYGGQIQEAKAKFAALRSEKDNLIQQRNQITARLRQTRDEKDSAIKNQRSARANLKFGSESEYEAAIAELKHKQETSSMSLNEEKRVIKEIEQLQAQKLQVSAISGDQGVVDKQNESIKETRALQTKKNEEIDAVQEKLNEQKAALDELYRLNEEENKKDQFPVLAKERKEIKEQLDEKFTELKALRKEFKEANDKYYNNIRLVRKKKELERQKEEEARKAEYEAKLADYEKEMAKIHPYQDEMDLCDALVLFMEKTYAKELKEEGAKAAETAAAPVELDGMKPLQRKEEDFMMLGGGKKGKKGRSGKKPKKDAKLVLPLAQLEAFSTIGLLPPAAVGAVSESLAAVKAKKVWFNEQTSRPTTEKPAEVAAEVSAPAKIASPKKKSNKNKKFNAGDQDAFPSLGGVAAELPSWGPGMAAPVAAEPAVAAEFAGADVVTEDE
ncbi:Nuclear segregation protein bfr1 [Phytophthora palmivora]|uniref:Nuclear segregation protein bfr1 n=1 Tax=Phytophthora palmivora TaxID=4796 RepID=A0A2P4X435_9STRA|nr:Nuclear segregation protein bfr1 [Phytophthora palmivora]